MSVDGLIGVALHLSDSLKSSSGIPDEAQAPKERDSVPSKRDCSNCSINLLF